MEGIYAHADLLKVYKAILDATQQIATYLRYHSGKYKSNLPTGLAIWEGKVIPHVRCWYDDLSPTGSLIFPRNQ